MGERYENWQEGIEKAKRDIEDKTSEESWREASAAFGDSAPAIVASGATFGVSVIAATGLTVKGGGYRGVGRPSGSVYAVDSRWVGFWRTGI